MYKTPSDDWMFFIVIDKQRLKKYTEIWETIKELVKINFENNPVYGDDDKYIKTKIKIFAGSINTSFHNKKMPKSTLKIFINNNDRFSY